MIGRMHSAPPILLVLLLLSNGSSLLLLSILGLLVNITESKPSQSTCSCCIEAALLFAVSPPSPSPSSSPLSVSEPSGASE